MRTRTLAPLLAAAVSIPLIAAGGVLPASADGHAPAPIVVEQLTPRSTFPDDVGVKIKVKRDGRGTQVSNARDASRLVVARITVQPGARFPLHTHPGPVVVNVVSGEVTYVVADGCEEHVYPAGTAFVDTGQEVHTAFGSSAGVTTLIATFFGAPETGPLTVPEAVQSPACT